MISFNSLLFTIIFIVLVIGFTDFFVKIPYENRCEMTYMYQVPQYVPIDLGLGLMKEFPGYRLYVYGEGDYAESLALNEFNGVPVLFVPGNGGSYKQARSLASVSLMMSHSSSSQTAHFNYFTVDYNEELSAFIGDKLETQTLFLYHSVRRVLQLYRHHNHQAVPRLKLVLIGHSVGGILIKALLSRPYFSAYLSHVAVVFTLATPHRSPAMPFDRRILSFYDTLQRSFAQSRPDALGHINFVSIGGSANDKLIRSDLISLGSLSHPLDISILTTAIDDVWASADHLCIVWCRQLMVKLNQLLFDLVDPKYDLIDSAPSRQEIIDYHLRRRYFPGSSYPSYRPPGQVLYSNRSSWILHDQDRLVRLNISKLVNPANHLFPLHERETIVLHIMGQLKHSTLSVCRSAPVEGKPVCIEDGLNLFDQVRLVPGWSAREDRHRAHIRAQHYLEMGFTHLVLSLTPTGAGGSGAYSVLVDRFTTTLRQHRLSLPSLWSFIFTGGTGGFFKPVVVFTKLISQEQAFFNLSLANVAYVWQTYYLTVQTRSCYRAAATFLGYGQLSLARTPELNELHWPFSPVKGAALQFTLKLNRDLVGVAAPPPSLQLHLEPNCGFELLARFSLIDFSSQLVKQYFTLLVPVIISTAALVVSVQLSNMMLLYSYSGEEWAQFKSAYHHSADLGGGGGGGGCSEGGGGSGTGGSSLSARKCLIYLSAARVMTTGRYFYYCYVQIVFYSVLSLVCVNTFYPWHDLANLAALPPPFIFLVISALFLFAYSLLFCFTVLVHTLANNFAHGINFVRVRAALVPPLGWPFSLLTAVLHLRWERICACLAVSSAICAFFFLPQLVFYLMHTCFTLLMLVRFIEVNHVEERVGRTTSTTFIRALYPVVYALMLVLAVLHIPQTIDSINDFAGFSSTTGGGLLLAAAHLPPSSSVLRIAFSQFVHTLLHRPLATFQALLVILLYFFLHFNSPRLSCRLNVATTSWSQKWTSFLLVAVAFGNLLIGVLAFEFINYAVLLTLAVITAAKSALSRQVNARVAFKLD